MSHLDILREIESRSLSISLENGDLRLQGVRDRMDPEFVARIRAAKDQLVAYLAEQAGTDRGFPLTPLQRSYLLGREGVFEIGDVASHVYHEIEGVWDLDRLESALEAVVRRHSALRGRFPADDRQVTEAPPHAPRITRLDLRGESEAQRRATRLALRAERSHRVLPADTGPLIAVDVTILADDRMVLHLSHDGLVMDGISMFLFFRSWWHAYERGIDPDAPEELSFDAYVATLEAARDRQPARRSRDYWLERVDDLAPHPDLPLRVSPAAITQARFTQRQVRLTDVEWKALKEHAGQAGLTPSALLLAAYAETLSTWGAGNQFTVNTTVANRPPVHPRAFEAIGQFSDTMLVEVEIDRQLPFVDRARAVQARLRADLDHRHFSGIQLMQELARRRGGVTAARMPFTFNSAIGYVREEVDGSALELFGPEVYSVSQTPQVWLNAFAMEQHGGLVVQLDGVDELFPEGLLDDLTHGYRTLLRALVDAEVWQHTDVDLLPTAQRARRDDANDTAWALPETMLGDAFVAQAVRAPRAPAAITSEGALSYGELLGRAAYAARWLRERGVARDELVGLVLSRGPEQLVGVLAAVLAGAAYLPIDASLPAERRAYMLRDGRVRCVLSNTGFDDTSGQREVFDLRPAHGAEDGAAAEVPTALPGANPDDLAYVLYTSGTTGEPKGVMISHRNVANVVADCHERFGIRPTDRFFAISAFTFDLSVWDIFGALSAGAALAMPDRARATDPAHWLELCASAGVTVWNSVPAIVSLMHDQAVAEGPVPPALRLVMMSGDRIPPALPAALRRMKADLDVISLGGPTETTIWNILHPVGPEEDGSESIPYGRPNANNRAYILDQDGRDTPDWVTGEICAAGTGLARGYWGDLQRTDERFFQDARRGERLYRTGDLGRYLPDGSIAILGRGDFQIKVNGYRIEAGEVETRLVALDTIRRAVVASRPGARGDRLVAHLVAAGDVRPTEAELREALRRELPDYMVPSTLLWHQELPLTRNGKVDRKALAAMDLDEAPSAATGTPDAADTAPADELERRLTDIWSTVLRGAVGAHDNLYALGGDSIAAARILTTVRKEFKVTIPLDRMPQMETVRAMATHIRQMMADRARKVDA